MERSFGRPRWALRPREHVRAYFRVGQFSVRNPSFMTADGGVLFDTDGCVLHFRAVSGSMIVLWL